MMAPILRVRRDPEKFRHRYVRVRHDRATTSALLEEMPITGEGKRRNLLLFLFSKHYTENIPSRGSSESFPLIIPGTLNTDLKRIRSANKKNYPLLKTCNTDKKQLHVTPGSVGGLAWNMHYSSRRGI